MQSSFATLHFAINYKSITEVANISLGNAQCHTFYVVKYRFVFSNEIFIHSFCIICKKHCDTFNILAVNLALSSAFKRGDNHICKLFNVSSTACRLFQRTRRPVYVVCRCLGVAVIACDFLYDFGFFSEVLNIFVDIFSEIG